jgi:hypothetical protein
VRDEEMRRYAAALTDAIERPWRERALAAEARVRDLEETVGELVALVDIPAFLERVGR